MTRPPGTAGYGETVEALIGQYESLAFADVHRELLPFLPAPPARVLDIGAGTGRDAVIVTILPDSGRSYLSKIYNDEWMKEMGWLD